MPRDGIAHSVTFDALTNRDSIARKFPENEAESRRSVTADDVDERLGPRLEPALHPHRPPSENRYRQEMRRRGRSVVMPTTVALNYEVLRPPRFGGRTSRHRDAVYHMANRGKSSSALETRRGVALGDDIRQFDRDLIDARSARRPSRLRQRKTEAEPRRRCATVPRRPRRARSCTRRARSPLSTPPSARFAL